MYKIVKKTVYFCLFFILVGSCLIHILSQYRVLQTANNKNNAYKKDINLILIENKIMRQQIEYASSSAFMIEKVKGELELGDKNDYKIILDNQLKDIDLYPKQKNVEINGKIKQWFKLFTP